MKVLILAAGFGTRLEKDLKDSQQYEHLIGVPKALLPVGHIPLISHWMSVLEEVTSVEEVYVVTNGQNHSHFEDWAKNWTKVHLLSDNSTSNETRTGAVGCMELIVRHFKVTDHLLVIAGDTLFFEDFNLLENMKKFETFQDKDEEASMLVYVNCPEEDVHKYGILETEQDGRVTGFLEKPQPSETESRKQCPCFYFLNNKSLPLLAEFLTESQDKPLKARDATGNFVAYLYQKKPVFAVEISGRFDVGGLASYLECHHYFKQKAVIS